MRWSEAGYLSRIVLTHAPRQASASLILDVRQNTSNEPIKSMEAWITYFSKLFASLFPLVLILGPLLFFQMRRMRKITRNHDEALELQRRSVALLEEQVRDQKALMELLGRK